MTLTLRVITPTKILWDDSTPEVILPTTTGQVGILTGHVSMVTFIEIGVMRIRYEKVWIPIFVKGGFAQVEADEVTVLVNAAERGNEIDLATAESDLETARESLILAQSRLERMRAERAIAQARARSQAARDFPGQVALNLPRGRSPENTAVAALKTLEKL